MAMEGSESALNAPSSEVQQNQSSPRKSTPPAGVSPFSLRICGNACVLTCINVMIATISEDLFGKIVVRCENWNFVTAFIVSQHLMM